jgi:ribosomal protein S18 acetylase RimI-like enzyme
LPDVVIRPLQPEDVYSFRDLRFGALQDYPACFATSVSEWKALDIDEIAKMLSAGDAHLVFGAFAGERDAGTGLVGIVGFRRQGKEKYRHKASVWGLYVGPEYQGRGVARALLERLIAHARDQSGLRQIHLTVTGDNPARALYEKLGFRAYGVEPGAINTSDDDYQDEVLMALDLRE